MIAEISVYVILGLILYYFANTEMNDLTCPQGPNTKDKKLCGEGNGKSYNGSAPETKDKTSVLLKKINIAATAARRDVVWRRSYIIACACLILLFMLVLKRFPNAPETVLTVFIIMTVTYFTHSMYNYHHYAHSEKNILNSTELLMTRLSAYKLFRQSPKSRLYKR